MFIVSSIPVSARTPQESEITTEYTGQWGRVSTVGGGEVSSSQSRLNLLTGMECMIGDGCMMMCEPQSAVEESLGYGTGEENCQVGSLGQYTTCTLSQCYNQPADPGDGTEIIECPALPTCINQQNNCYSGYSPTCTCCYPCSCNDAMTSTGSSRADGGGCSITCDGERCTKDDIGGDASLQCAPQPFWPDNKELECDYECTTNETCSEFDGENVTCNGERMYKSTCEYSNDTIWGCMEGGMIPQDDAFGYGGWEGSCTYKFGSTNTATDGVTICETGAHKTLSYQSNWTTIFEDETPQGLIIKEVREIVCTHESRNDAEATKTGVLYDSEKYVGYSKTSCTGWSCCPSDEINLYGSSSQCKDGQLCSYSRRNLNSQRFDDGTLTAYDSEYEEEYTDCRWQDEESNIPFDNCIDWIEERGCDDSSPCKSGDTQRCEDVAPGTCGTIRCVADDPMAAEETHCDWDYSTCRQSDCLCDSVNCPNCYTNCNYYCENWGWGWIFGCYATSYVAGCNDFPKCEWGTTCPDRDEFEEQCKSDDCEDPCWYSACAEDDCKRIKKCDGSCPEDSCRYDGDCSSTPPPTTPPPTNTPTPCENPGSELSCVGESCVSGPCCGDDCIDTCSFDDECVTPSPTPCEDPGSELSCVGESCVSGPCCGDDCVDSCATDDDCCAIPTCTYSSCVGESCTEVSNCDDPCPESSCSSDLECAPCLDPCSYNTCEGDMCVSKDGCGDCPPSSCSDNYDCDCNPKCSYGICFDESCTTLNGCQDPCPISECQTDLECAPCENPGSQLSCSGDSCVSESCCEPDCVDSCASELDCCDTCPELNCLGDF
ncbi:MAG: hypothetical protein ACTSWQ_03730, partial [Candidatus Thorarchaeota archaeon]